MDDTSASLWLIAYSSLGRLEFGHQGWLTHATL
jgi:hypothetical protein